MAKRVAMVLAIAALGGLFAACFGDGDGELPGFLDDESPTPDDTETPTAESEVAGSSSTATPDGPLEYEIKPGDTLSAIAVQFDTTVLAIVELNGIVDPAVIQPGDVIRIPQ